MRDGYIEQKLLKLYPEGIKSKKKQYSKQKSTILIL